MRRELIYRNEAVSDLAETKAYTARTWGKTRARHYVSSLVQDINRLKASALRHALFDEVFPALRRKRSGMHHIYYLTFPDRIEVIRIMHVQRDPGLHLKSERWSEPD